MLTLLPAGRTIIDRRREARGALKPPRPIATALPGIERLAETLGRSLTRRPAPYIVVVVVVTISLGYAATGLKSEYSIRDLLPRGGSVLSDLNTLDTAVGGSTEMASVLVKAEASETRTLINIRDLESAFEDPDRRPMAAAGPILVSYDLVLRDWTTDSGEPGDKYDAEIARRFREASADVEIDSVALQAILDDIEAQDPALSRVLVNNPDGIDSILLQFPAYTGDPYATKHLQEEIEALWFGEDDAITATSEAVVSFAVTDAIRGQANGVDQHDGCGRDHSSGCLLLGDGSSACFGFDCGRPHSIGSDLSTRDDGTFGNSLHARHVDNHRFIHRYRR